MRLTRANIRGIALFAETGYGASAGLPITLEYTVRVSCNITIICLGFQWSIMLVAMLLPR